MSSRANSGISLHPSKRGDWAACTRVGSAGGWECARWHIELEWWGGAAGFAGAIAADDEHVVKEAASLAEGEQA